MKQYLYLIVLLALALVGLFVVAKFKFAGLVLLTPVVLVGLGLYLLYACVVLLKEKK